MPTIGIATPQSTLFNRAEPEEARRILGLSDALELRDHVATQVQSPLPRLYHCELSLVAPWTNAELDTVVAVATAHQPPIVSFHVPSPYVKAPVVARRFVPGGAAMSERAMLENAARNIKRIRAAAGERTYLIENNNCFPTGGYETVGEPRFLNALVDQAGVGLLLDIGHAEITAWYRKTSLDDYLGGLPLEQVGQIHLSGIYRGASEYEDAHEALTAVDWENAARIIPRCPNVTFLTIEYYYNPGVLVDMLARLRALLDALPEAGTSGAAKWSEAETGRGL